MKTAEQLKKEREAEDSEFRRAVLNALSVFFFLATLVSMVSHYAYENGRDNPRRVCLED